MVQARQCPTPAFALTPIWTRSKLHRPCSCSQRRSRQAVTARLPASVATVRDARTGAQIYLVGCVHGSQILELCEPRLASLKASLQHEESTGTKLKRKPRSFAQVSKTFGGAGPAVVAFALETVYRLQTVSGISPGVEFHAALQSPTPWLLICGDAPARDTVQHLSRIFTSPLLSLRTSLSSVGTLLRRVTHPPKGGVNIPRLFLTEPCRVRELLRVLGPAALLATAMSVTGNAGAAVLGATSAGLGEGSVGGWAMHVAVTVGQVAVVGYVVVSTLRFLQVLIADRDRILAQSVLDAAQHVRDGRGEGRVCAVVGLLHVNGILRHIQRQNGAKV